MAILVLQLKITLIYSDNETSSFLQDETTCAYYASHISQREIMVWQILVFRPLLIR